MPPSARVYRPAWPPVSVVSLASATSKALVPGVLLPVGIVTAIIGVPVFLVLIFKRSERV